MSNQWMSVYHRLRLDSKQEQVEIKAEEREVGERSAAWKRLRPSCRDSSAMADGGNHNLHDRTRIGIRKTQAPTQLNDSLPHSANTNSNALRTQLNDLFFNTLPVVTHRDEYRSLPFDHPDDSVSRSRMSEHVGERLLHDAENGGFKLRSHAWQIGRLNLENDFNPTSIG